MRWFPPKPHQEMVSKGFPPFREIWGVGPLAVTDFGPISPVFYSGSPVWGPVPGSL